MQPDDLDDLLQDLIDVQFAADIIRDVIDLRVEFDPVLNRHVLKLPWHEHEP